MNKEKFLEILSTQLQVLDEKEKQDILDEYALHIDMKVSEGLSEEKAIEDFGDVKELVKDILEAYHVNPEYCTPTQVKKKEWKTPDMGKVREEGMEVCTKAGGFLKRMLKACKEKCGYAFNKCGNFFRNWWNRLKNIAAKEEKIEVQMKEKKERHIIKNIWHECKSAVIWIARFCWNTLWFLSVLMFVIMTAIALFLFGMLIILNAQGYPLMGVTLGSLGTILMFGALSGLALSFRKKRSVKQSQEVQYD